jgi:gluconolactonase
MIAACRRFAGITLFFLLNLSSFVPAVARQTSRSEIFPGNVVPENLFKGGEFTEGPAVGPDGAVYFSDLTWVSKTRMEAGHIWRCDPATGATSVFRSPSNMSNGIAFDRTGTMIILEGELIGGGRIIAVDPATHRGKVLAATYKGKPFNSPNDLDIDSRGRIYFTDPHYGDDANLPQPIMGVYRLDPDGSVALIIDSISMPNGIAVSRDQKTLHVGCFDEGREGVAGSKKMYVAAFDLNGDGTVGKMRILVDYGQDDGPDGMTVDRAGNLFIAVRDEQSPGIHVYNSNGTPIDFCPLPEIPSNVTLANERGKTVLYCTAGKSLYKILLSPSVTPR